MPSSYRQPFAVRRERARVVGGPRQESLRLAGAIGAHPVNPRSRQLLRGDEERQMFTIRRPDGWIRDAFQERQPVHAILSPLVDRNIKCPSILDAHGNASPVR